MARDVVHVGRHEIPVKKQGTEPFMERWLRSGGQHDCEHDSQIRQRRREDPESTAKEVIAEADGAGLVFLPQQEGCDEEAADHEEQGDRIHSPP